MIAYPHIKWESWIPAPILEHSPSVHIWHPCLRSGATNPSLQLSPLGHIWHPHLPRGTTTSLLNRAHMAFPSAQRGTLCVCVLANHLIHGEHTRFLFTLKSSSLIEVCTVSLSFQLHPPNLVDHISHLIKVHMVSLSALKSSFFFSCRGAYSIPIFPCASSQFGHLYSHLIKVHIVGKGQ